MAAVADVADASHTVGHLGTSSFQRTATSKSI